MVFLAASIIFSCFKPNVSHAYLGGLLDGQTMFLTVGTGDLTSTNKPTTKITDNNVSTFETLSNSSINAAYYRFSTPTEIGSFRLNVSNSAYYYMFRVAAYDSSKKLLGSITPTGNDQKINFAYPNVSYIQVYNTNTGGVNLLEFDVFGPTVPPKAPSGLSGTPDVNAVNLNWNKLTVSGLLGYNVYVNGVKNNTSLVTTNSYRASGLASDTNYTFYVTAVNDYGESPQSNVVTVMSMAPPLYPNLAYQDLGSTSFKVTWNQVGTNYEIYLNDSHVGDTTYPFYNFSALSPFTNYKVYIVSVDKYGRRNNSNVLNIKTLAPEPNTPELTVSNISFDSFKVSWSPDPYVQNYSVYLNGVKKADITASNYTFTGLKELTKYDITIVANGSTSSKSANTSTTTEKRPVPTVTNASLKLDPGGGGSLSYVTTGSVTGINLYINGKLIGTYPNDGKPISVDLAPYAALPKSDFKLEPVDPGGKEYVFSSKTSSIGLDELDQIISDLAAGFGISKSAFIWLALTSIPLIILAALFFWFRRKFYGIFGKRNTDRTDLKEEYKSSMTLSPDGKTFSKMQLKSWSQQNKTDNTKTPTDNFKVVAKDFMRVPVGFLGTGGTKIKPDFTYERNGVQYKKVYERGKGQYYKPKDLSNQIKHVSNQFKAVKSSFTGSNKKPK